jgi:hypothetical protein
MATDPSNCGKCGTVCSTAVAGATPTCAASQCGFKCTASYPDSCGGGCVDFKSDPKNCSKCGGACVGNQQCIASVCQCTGGTHLCGGTCVANDVNACGPSCTKCTAPTGGTVSCNGTSCAQSCTTAGDSICSNVCVDLQSDDNNCGTCAKKCTTALTGATSTCVARNCQVSCTDSTATLCSSGCFNLKSDQHNCGRCGHDCFSGTCSNGKCQPWIVAQPPTTTKVTALASDGSAVIWADTGPNAVFQVTSAGTGKITLASDASVNDVALAQNWPMALAGGTVVWGTSDHVWTAKVGTANSGKQFPFTFTGGSGVHNLAINPQGTYVGATFSNDSNLIDIYDCALAGTTCTKSGSIQPLFALGAVATSTTYFVVDPSNGSIDTHAFGSGSYGPFKSGLGTPSLLAADSNNLYWWAAGSGAAIKRVSLLGGAVSDVLTQFDSSTTFLIGLATDGTNVYVTTEGMPSTLVYGPVGGCCAATPLAAATNPTVVVAAGGKVFWVDGNTINAIAAP